MDKRGRNNELTSLLTFVEIDTVLDDFRPKIYIKRYYRSSDNRLRIIYKIL